MSALKELLTKAVAANASDIHIKPGAKPVFRTGGSLVDADAPAMDAGQISAIVREILPPHLTEDFAKEHEADFSHQEEGVGRFRINVFYSQGAPTLALRHVKDRVPSFVELNLPDRLKAIAAAQRLRAASTPR